LTHYSDYFKCYAIEREIHIMPRDLLYLAPLRTAFLSGELSATAVTQRVLKRVVEWDHPNQRYRPATASERTRQRGRR